MAPATSASRRGTGSRLAWSQLVSTKATKALRTSAKFAAASRDSAPMTLRDSCASWSSLPSAGPWPSRETWSSSEWSIWMSAPATSNSASSLGGRTPVAMSRTTRRCSSTTPRAASRPTIPRVSPMRSSASACGCRPATSARPARSCRSSASLTRSRSSLSAAATVSSSARLRPARLPRACSNSASVGSTSRLGSASCASGATARAVRNSFSRGSRTIGMSRWPPCSRSR